MYFSAVNRLEACSYYSVLLGIVDGTLFHLKVFVCIQLNRANPQ